MNYFILESPEKLPTLDEIKKLYINAVLELNNGNRTKTSKHLGISLRTLRNWINDQYGCQDGRRCNQIKRCEKHALVKTTQVLSEKTFAERYPDHNE